MSTSIPGSGTKGDVAGVLTADEKGRPEDLVGRVKQLSIRRSVLLRLGFVIGLSILLVVAVTAAFPGALAPHDPELQNLRGRLQAPMWVSPEGTVHYLGTDQLGRDLLSRLIYGARVPLLVVFGVLPLSAGVGILLGMVSGYFGDWVDDVIMRLVDVRLALPFILVLLAIIAIVGPGLRNMILVLAALQWVDYTKLIRGEVLSIREREYILSAEAAGANDSRIISRHILPNILSTALVVASIEAPSLILTEAALSFLGLGVPPSVPSWGRMLSETKDYLWLSPWASAFPGLAITVTVLALNLIGDALRDYFDPHMR